MKQNDTQTNSGENMDDAFKRIDKTQASINKGLQDLKIMSTSERIRFTRTTKTLTKGMTIYYVKLTDEQKQQLENIDKLLFAMANEVTEEETRTLKAPPKDDDDEQP
jgi:hypothetical protein